MELVQSLQTTTSLVMTQRMQMSLKILHMNNQDLTDFLAKKAEENPYVELRMPSFSGGKSEDFDQIAALSSDQPSLYSHISSQIELAFTDERRKRVAYAFLEALEPCGWMTTDPQIVALGCQVPSALAESVLSELKTFEPGGIFAASLSDCLRLQAMDQGLLTWELEALIDNLPLLAVGKTAELAEICDCEVEDIPEIVAILRQFDPKPGQKFLDDRAPVFPPDLTVRRGAEGWVVELNRSSLPAIEISDASRAATGTTQSETRAYRARALSEARWLASSLLRRQTTLLQTATAIVARQGAFLDRGAGSLEPLSLADIGEALELHPSTISRAIAGRLIDTPAGALPLKAFFSRSFPSNDGDAAPSQDAVLDMVRRIVGSEDPVSPLSDTAIAELAAKQGIKIARRTVAKFRGILGIASSYVRRRQAVLA
ncbi:MAG: RNA polymerase factor sigma-54 [Pseudomonadota bacterium]